jgi:capsule polysaccharide export protein KpsC/LpsZ
MHVNDAVRQAVFVARDTLTTILAALVAVVGPNLFLIIILKFFGDWQCRIQEIERLSQERHELKSTNDVALLTWQVDGLKRSQEYARRDQY